MGMNTLRASSHTSAVSPASFMRHRIAKRHSRIFQEGALTLQHDADLSSQFCVLVAHTVNFNKNWILPSGGRSPTLTGLWHTAASVGYWSWRMSKRSSNTSLSKWFLWDTLMTQKHTRYGYPNPIPCSKQKMLYLMSWITLNVSPYMLLLLLMICQLYRWLTPLSALFHKALWAWCLNGPTTPNYPYSLDMMLANQNLKEGMLEKRRMNMREREKTNPRKRRCWSRRRPHSMTLQRTSRRAMAWLQN